MATEDSFDLETDDLSVPYDVSVALFTSPYVSAQETAKSGKRKCESDCSSSSDSDETESISISVEHLKHLSVEGEIIAQAESNDDEDVVNTNDTCNTCFSDEICEDKDGDTPLHILTIFQETYKLLWLLDSCNKTKLNGLINRRNKLGQTALHIAACLPNLEIIEYLLYAGADLGIQDKTGRTIYHILAQTGNVEILETLSGIFEMKDISVDYSGGPCRLTEVPDFDGLTALHIAVINNNRDMVNHLLSLGAHPGTKERRSGRTALHFAAEAGNMDLVRIIAARKEVFVDAKSFNGQTALVVAFHRGHSRVVDFLRERGAEFDSAVIKQYGPMKRKTQRKK